MTVTNQYVAPIDVAQQPGGLIQTSRPLPLEDWRGGITFSSVCTTLGRWGCITDGSGEKSFDARSEPVRFDPFMLYSGTTCSGAPDEQELRGIARAGLVRGRSGEIAHELVTSLVDNPDLSTYAVDVTPNDGGSDPEMTPAGLMRSLSILLGAAKACGGGEFVLHANTSALPYLLKAGVVWDGSQYRLGAITVSVDDYPFTDDTEDLVDVDYSTLTPLYLTRPIELETAEVIDSYDLATRLNQGTALSEDLAILRFDTCCAFYAIADLSVVEA